jgi:hypothetical protein
MNFKTFLDQLPNFPGPTQLPISETPGGFLYVHERLSEFIGPDLVPSTVVEQPQNPQIVIISAAGAVGKSTLAKEMACEKQAPIWDLAQASAVGANSMTGQITASFGFQLAAEVIKKLAGGKLFLIVDALDEARVKANEAGFEAFVENLAEIAKQSIGTAIVLLGRTQTAETTWLLLNAAGVSTSLVSILPFTRKQAEAYIEARIQHFDEAAAKRIADHRQPFIDARDLILNHLERAVSGEDTIDDETAREFLGYAPVLETVAVLLAKEDNYQEFISGLRSTGKEPRRQMDRPLSVLQHVVTRLLEREQKQKLQANIKPKLEKAASQAGWNSWESLYSPGEQITRLLGRILGRSFDACPSMPVPVRALYEEQLAIWLPEHPFLREGHQAANMVFESYLFAIAMREYLTELSRLVEGRVGATSYKPSRLLADFYILLGEHQGEEVVAGRQIGLLYDSLLAGETDSLRVRLSVESGDPDEEDDEITTGEGEFELVYTTPTTAGREHVEIRKFKIVGDEGLIAFGRQLKEATVITRGSVILGGAVDDFEIGPNVDIRCGKLSFISNGLVVRGGSRAAEFDAVVMNAVKCESRVSRKPVVRGALSVSWPDAQSYPWTDFAMDSIDHETDDKRVHEVRRRFQRIVTTLRSHSKGSLARYKGKIEHRRVLQNEVGRELLKKLLSEGIMKIKEDFYHWVPERASAVLKVSWHDLRQRRVSPELHAFLNQFIGENPGLF